MPGIKLIIVKTQFEGVHCYPGAPEAVKFLRNEHRHIFHVEAEIEVFHNDRELEFFLVKRSIDDFIHENYKSYLDSTSCEMIAESIQRYIKRKYPMEESNKYNVIRRGMNAPTDSRVVNVKVFEDGENGAMVKEV